MMNESSDNSRSPGRGKELVNIFIDSGLYLTGIFSSDTGCFTFSWPRIIKGILPISGNCLKLGGDCYISCAGFTADDKSGGFRTRCVYRVGNT